MCKNYKIVRYSREYRELWDDYILQNPDGSFWHSSIWSNVLMDIFHFHNLSILAMNNSKVIGIFPLFLMKNIFLKKFLISNPFSNYAGPISDNGKITDIFIKWVTRQAIKQKVQYVEIRGFNEYNDLPQNDVFTTMILPLNGSIDDIWKNYLKGKTRNQIRKAGKAGLVCKDNNKYLDAFYKIYLKNITRLGTPVFPKKMFIFLKQRLNESMKILIVEKENKILAGLIWIKYGDTCYIPYASSLWEYNIYCPNNLLYWEAIKMSHKEGLKYFDFGRSTVDSGTFNFKKQWGGEFHNLKYQYIFNRTQKMPIANAKNNKYEFFVSIWRKLPFPVSENLSRAIVKYLPEL